MKKKLLKRLYAMRLLRIAKKRARYKDLEGLLGIDATLLARYVSGLVMPGPAQAERIINRLGGSKLLASILKESIEEHRGYVDLVPLLADIDYLCSLSLELSLRYSSLRVDTVLVPETSGIGLATLIASHLDASLVIARRRKENPMYTYMEEHLIIPPNIRRSFYVRRGLLQEGGRVLIVDDIIHTGLTLSVIRKIAEKAGSTIVGVASVVVVGNRWRENAGPDLRVEAILEYKPY